MGGRPWTLHAVLGVDLAAAMLYFAGVVTVTFRFLTDPPCTTFGDLGVPCNPLTTGEVFVLMGWRLFIGPLIALVAVFAWRGRTWARWGVSVTGLLGFLFFLIVALSPSWAPWTKGDIVWGTFGAFLAALHIPAVWWPGASKWFSKMAQGDAKQAG